MAFTPHNSIALVLAAGFGKRLRPITDACPKALVPVCGKTMLERACSHLYDAGFRLIAINTHYMGEMVKAFLPVLMEKFPQVHFHISHEPQLLDVGGGIRKVCKDLSAKEVLVFNCDSFVYEDGAGFLEPLVKSWDADKMDALLYLKRKELVYGREASGDFEILGDGRLCRAAEPSMRGYVYTGISIFTAEPLNSLSASPFHIMNDYIFPLLSGNHRFYGIEGSFGYVDIGTPETLQYANRCEVVKES